MLAWLRPRHPTLGLPAISTAGDLLARRGLVWSTATLAIALTPYGAPAAVPATLLQDTVSAGLMLAAGQSLAAGAVSAQTLTFMEATLQTMYYSKLKLAAAIALMVALTGTGVGVVSYQALGRADAAPGELVCLFSSEKFFEIAEVNGNAARRLGVTAGALVELEWE